MESIIPTLIATAESEWRFFGCDQTRLDGTAIDGRKEYQDGAWQRIGNYWHEIGGGYANLTGRDRGYPWSAAFISFCFKSSGAGARFPYSPAHSRFINAAIRNHDEDKPDAPLVGHKLADHVLKPGDLIGYWWGSEPIAFDTARRIGDYHSHTEIVVEVENRVARSIGGNVSHSVMLREVRLDAAGHLADGSANWFVAIENNL